MRKLWYVSGTLASTAGQLMRYLRHRRTSTKNCTKNCTKDCELCEGCVVCGIGGICGRHPAVTENGKRRRRLDRLTSALAMALAGGCASSSNAGGAGPTPAPVIPPGPPVAVHANLAGGRCHGATCTCRDPRGSAAETPPPDEGHKRFELRLAALDGSAALSSPTLGDFAAGEDEACYYIDVVPGTTHDVAFVARERRTDGGVGPSLAIAEYGPKGPWWYDVVNVHCAGPEGKCNREAADEWGVDIKKRKRGRIDPCGSAVITHLTWDTSGGGGAREMGLFRDLSVRFTMEVKKFATQFAPGSTECVPK